MSESTARPPRPNKEEYQSEMEAVTSRIDSLKDQLAKVTAKFPGKETGTSPASQQRLQAKTLFESLLGQKKGKCYTYYRVKTHALSLSLSLSLIPSSLCQSQNFI
jgi:hypothetical protein